MAAPIAMGRSRSHRRRIRGDSIENVRRTASAADTRQYTHEVAGPRLRASQSLKSTTIDFEEVGQPLGRTFKRRFVVTPLTLLRRKRGLLTQKLGLGLGGSPAAYPRESGPRFQVSSYEASLQELEDIVFHPDVIASVEAVSPTPLRPMPPPEARLPEGARSFGWPMRRTPARVYDVFPFGMDLELLEIRLHTMDDLVDVFVIAEAPFGYGCMKKPMYLARNWDRFKRFHHKMVRLEIDEAGFAELYPEGRRRPTDWAGDFFHRDQMWRRVRRLGIEPDAVILAGDADEMLSRDAVYMLKHYDCPLPMTFELPTLRYTFRWLDQETWGNIVAVSPESFPHLDHEPTFWHVPSRRFRVRGAAHYTSFFEPAVMNAKLAMTTDWDPGVEVQLRNEHGETARMMREGRWLNSWALTPYDCENDPLGFIPSHARANRERYSRLWGDLPSTDRS